MNFVFRLEGKDILTFLGEKPRANEEDICFAMRPLLDVVNYLHGQQIVHLDLRVRESTFAEFVCQNTAILPILSPARHLVRL